MAEIGGKRLKTVEDGWNPLKTAENSLKRLKRTIEHGWKWFKMAKILLKQLKTIENCWKWLKKLKTVEKGWKLLKLLKQLKMVKNGYKTSEFLSFPVSKFPSFKVSKYPSFQIGREVEGERKRSGRGSAGELKGTLLTSRPTMYSTMLIWLKMRVKDFQPFLCQTCYIWDRCPFINFL